MHNPARYGFTLTDSGVRDDQLDRLTEEKFICGFNKNTAATDIFYHTGVFLITAIKMNWPRTDVMASDQSI